jgi:hypothetical protein
MLTRILLTRNYYVLNIFEIFLMVLKEKKITFMLQSRAESLYSLQTSVLYGQWC